MYYASFGMLAIVIHVIINFEAMRKHHSGIETLTWRRYASFLRGILLYYIVDVLWGFLFDLKIVPLVYADTVLYFLSMGLTVFLWMRFTVAFLNRDNLFSKILTYAGWGIFIFETVTVVVNFFIPVMFSFEADGTYNPGFARYLNLGIQVLLFAMLAIYTFISAMKVGHDEKPHYRANYFSGLVMTAFIILQALEPLLPFYAIGCLIANCIIHTFVEVDEKADHDRELGSVRRIAYKDPLTHVRNTNAYTEAKLIYDRMIRDQELKELGVIVFDLNNLKSVNDTLGHDAGDKYLQQSCKMICGIFKHSPVFRIGGDEFVTVLEGEDYQNRHDLFASFNEQVEHNMRNGGAVIAGGMEIYDPGCDRSFEEVFEKADVKMYERKKQLKG